ncbi:diguanylate cyclase [Shimia marina]|uniref:diguanylate cyclase n=1 Tax=Shimia marina TaxID=321267 RepID=A0A0P1ES53_9RHOB|nr:diguanylate cyclase [Shimia marina]CUH53218.1 Stalked cell differentiation-controlling protein [Shimia marina]SFD82207.1 two-component system, cell cycle response regulator [Shimia marina]
MAAHVLIVDSISANRILLKVKLAGAFVQVEQAASAGEALDLLQADLPDLLVLGGDLVDMSALTLCAKIKENPAFAHLPILLVHTDGSRADRIAALRAGADDAFEMSVTTDALLARIRSIMRARNSYEELRLREQAGRLPGLADAMQGFDRPAQVLIAGHSTATGQEWCRQLQRIVPYGLRSQPLPEIMRDMSQFSAPDAIVISLQTALPEDALRLLAEVRARATTREAAVLVVLDENNDSARVNALDLGANDVLSDGFDAEEAALRLDSMIARKRLADRLRKRVDDGLAAAVTDPLTGLFNRRYAMPHLSKMAQHADTQRADFAVMLADLDHFKRVNDRFGHAAGDMVLAEVARRMRRCLSQTDLIARMGGEEFLIVAQTDNAEDAAKIAERLCDAVRTEPVALRGRDIQIPVTVSIGVAMGSEMLKAKKNALPNCAKSHEAIASALIDRADQALYGAKAEGRDKVTLSLPAA